VRIPPEERPHVLARGKKCCHDFVPRFLGQRKRTGKQGSRPSNLKTKELKTKVPKNTN